MKGKARSKMSQFTPELIVKSGKPTAVIIPLDEYRDLMARLEDAEDVKILKRIRKKSLRFRSLDAYLKERAGRI